MDARQFAEKEGCAVWVGDLREGGLEWQLRITEVVDQG